MGTFRRHKKAWIAGVVALVAVLAVGLPWAYINLIEGDAPAALSVDSAPSASAGPGAATVTDIAGAWTVGEGSQAGYRVKETLAGQDTTAVGRTSEVTGSVTIAGSRATKGEFTVDMTSVASDQSRRDSQFTGRIMETSQFPTGTFVLTAPIELGSEPAVGATVTASATGDLTLHGVTKPVTFPVSVKRSAAGVAVSGSVPVTFSDYQIDNPSVGGFVSVGDSGLVEFLLVLTKK